MKLMTKYPSLTFLKREKTTGVKIAAPPAAPLAEPPAALICNCHLIIKNKH